jgi:hypothetical protein
VNHELIRSPEEDLRWKVSPQFATMTALDRDRLEGESPDAGWNVAAASLARDNECLAVSGCWEHASMIGK